MEYLNKVFFDNTILEWLIAIGYIAGSFIAVKMVYWIISNVIKKLTKKTKTKLDDILIDKLQKPIVYSIILLGYWIAIHDLNFSDKSILTYLENIGFFATIIILTSIISRIVDAFVTEVVLPYAEKTERGQNNFLLPVIRKTLRSVIWIFGIIIGLDNIGLDITAMIAGLGIGGLALALAAQDSVKNIFAGIMIFLDKPFKIQDRIQIEGYDGIIEEVGLRSTRLRTLDGRIVTIPNSTFTDQSVVNITSQPSLKIKLNLGLTYDTNEKDMQKGIDILNQIVADNQDILDETCEAGFKDFGDFSLGILFIYFIKPESHWLNSQHIINKEILKRFNEAGLEFAFPTQTILKKEI